MFAMLCYYIFCLQDKIIENLGSEMDSTSNRLDFVQVHLNARNYCDTSLSCDIAIG